ncbi:MAG: hypothetical protein AMS15_02495 [Planctomycetes bacterium DG_23]|nr:MAG: hypothetical protein AMS15_02495 [Planctomycetes bacterium DG_23]
MSESEFVAYRAAKIGKQIVLPLSKAVEISLKGMSIRFWRSLLTVSLIVLAIAFLVYILATAAIVASLVRLDDPQINIILQRSGVEAQEIGAGGQGSLFAQISHKQYWLIVLSLMVCVVGITNAMLMSVTERFREIGTMKCLGALDSFIVKLFLLESSFQGIMGTAAGIVLGVILAILHTLVVYGSSSFRVFPGLTVLSIAGISLFIGTCLSVVGAILPAVRAARMEPVVAMRVEE